MFHDVFLTNNPHYYQVRFQAAWSISTSTKQKHKKKTTVTIKQKLFADILDEKN